MFSVIRAIFAFNPKVLGALVLGAFLAGSVSGGWVVHKFWSGATARAEVAALKRTLAAREKAAQENSRLLQEHQTELEQLKERVSDVTENTPDSVCLAPADTDRLRSLWNDTGSRSRSR